MSKIGLKLAIAGASVVVLSACSVFDPNNGARVENNISQQTVDRYAGFDENVATLDGVKAEKLLKEYRSERSEAPTEKLLEDVGN